MSDSGFALSELLIVVAVIAVISSLGLVAFSYSQKEVRDTRRQADLQSLAYALESYHDSVGVYPASSGYIEVSEGSLGELTPEHTTVLPEDPVFSGSGNYAYVSLDGGSCFCLSARMELTKNADSRRCTGSAGHEGNSYTISCL